MQDSHRGSFSTTEASFQNAFELLSYVATIVWSLPHQFRYPILLSTSAVYTAGLLFAIFLRSRGHHLHIPPCMKRKRSGRAQWRWVIRDWVFLLRPLMFGPVHLPVSRVWDFFDIVWHGFTAHLKNCSSRCDLHLFLAYKICKTSNNSFVRFCSYYDEWRSKQLIVVDKVLNWKKIIEKSGFLHRDVHYASSPLLNSHFCPKHITFNSCSWSIDMTMTTTILNYPTTFLLTGILPSLIFPRNSSKAFFLNRSNFFLSFSTRLERGRCELMRVRVRIVSRVGGGGR